MNSSPMNHRDTVDLHDLVIFLRDAQQRFESKNDSDVAFVMEMMSEFFEKDYKPSKKLVFTGSAVGL